MSKNEEIEKISGDERMRRIRKNIKKLAKKFGLERAEAAEFALAVIEIESVSKDTIAVLKELAGDWVEQHLPKTKRKRAKKKK